MLSIPGIPDFSKDKSDHRIKTPHAAMIIWNYQDRIDPEFSAGNIDDINATILGTVSIISIATSKSKSSPAGSFQVTLAPWKNWVSTITAGSWCAILMSNSPISETDLKVSTSAKHLKMIGRIESVRIETRVGDDGARHTLYHIVGADWGTIFNNILYVDNRLSGDVASQLLGNGAAQALQKDLIGDNGTASMFQTNTIIKNILKLFGSDPLASFASLEEKVGGIGHAAYNLKLPRAMASYLNQGIGPLTSNVLSSLIDVKSGKLVAQDVYDNKAESMGILNPFSLQGSHTFWQILIENSNPALNELFCELRWENQGIRTVPKFTLYNRIRPFSIRGGFSLGSFGSLKSYFQDVNTINIDPMTVTAVNAGTNWRDKYNFIEIKPNSQEYDAITSAHKNVTQEFDAEAFDREGFRPYIVSIKQYPLGSVLGPSPTINWEGLGEWAKLMKEWYFNTHRTLNGTIAMTGQDSYIAVGDNIKFDAGLINQTPNMLNIANATKKTGSLLAHVENVSHSFTVGQDGARSFTTTIQFVRGIFVDDNGVPVGWGPLDQDASDLGNSAIRNTKNTITTSDPQDPDSQKLKGN